MVEQLIGDDRLGGQVDVGISVVGEGRVSARIGLVVNLHDMIQHPVSWRVAGLGGLALDVSDSVAEERELSAMWALWQDDKPSVQLGVRAKPMKSA